MFEVTVVSAAWWTYVLAVLACLIVSSQAVQRSASVVGLAVILAQQGLATLAALLAFTATSPELAALGYRAGTILWLLWAPAVSLGGALLLRTSRHARLASIAGVATGAPGVLLVLASFVAPGLVLAADGASLTPLAATSISLVFWAFAWLVALLAHDALTTRLPLQRIQLGLLSMAFALEGGFHAMQNASKVVFGFDVHGYERAGLPLTVVLVIPALFLIPVAGWAIARASATRAARKKRIAWGIAGCLGIAGATGALAAPLAAGDEFRDPFGMFHAFWDLAGLLLLAYAAHRFQLVSLEERAKQGIVISFVVSCGFILFGIVQALAERAIQDRYLGGLPANDVVAALVVALASLPLAKGGSLLARKAFPNMSLHARDPRRRAEEIYEAAVEGVLQDGTQSSLEARSLAGLRRTLGVSEADHARIESRVRGQLAMKAPVSPA